MPLSWEQLCLVCWRKTQWCSRRLAIGFHPTRPNIIDIGLATIYAGLTIIRTRLVIAIIRARLAIAIIRTRLVIAIIRARLAIILAGLDVVPCLLLSESNYAADPVVVHILFIMTP